MIPFSKTPATLAALAIAAGLALSVPAQAAPLSGLAQKGADAASAHASGIVLVHEGRYYKKKRSRYYRRHHDRRDHWRYGRSVDAPFTRYRRYHRGVDVDAPFASVRRRDHGVYVRAPFVDLYVPRWR